MSFPERLADRTRGIAACLDTAITGLPEGVIRDAMSYAGQGGKRLRGFLVIETAGLHDVAPDKAMPIAAAIEALHAYSLVHDDLPCMDDDALRRGQPTVHVKWDEATAVLVGDALQSLSFQLIAEADLSAGARLELIRSLAHAAGGAGMVLGQALDIAAESDGTALDLAGIARLQRLKTGALFEWSACAGPRMAGAGCTSLSRYARALGLAFQIADDVLDVEGDSAVTGKAVGKDAGAGKATFVDLLGLDAAKARARDLTEEACAALEPYGPCADSLRDCAHYVIARDS